MSQPQVEPGIYIVRGLLQQLSIGGRSLIVTAQSIAGVGVCQRRAFYLLAAKGINGAFQQPAGLAAQPRTTGPGSDAPNANGVLLQKRGQGFDGRRVSRYFHRERLSG